MAELGAWALIKISGVGAPVYRARVLLQADPAVLILALRTCHVIASIPLVARYETPRAKLAIVLLLPLKELSIDSSTLYPWVTTHPTLKANLFSTRTGCSFLKCACLFDVPIAASFGAPFELWVQIDVDVQFKSQVLLVKLL